MKCIFMKSPFTFQNILSKTLDQNYGTSTLKMYGLKSIINQIFEPESQEVLKQGILKGEVSLYR
jgi:hypothetical protein